MRTAKARALEQALREADARGGMDLTLKAARLTAELALENSERIDRWERDIRDASRRMPSTRY